MDSDARSLARYQSGTLMCMTRRHAELAALLPGLLGLDHVGIAVPDLEDAIGFYRDLLGLQVVHREDNLEQQVAEVMLKSGDAGPTGNQLQLLMPMAENSVLNRFLLRRGPGLHHVAYAVSDVRSASSILRQRGVRVLYDAPRVGTRGSQINFVHPKDTGGVLLELVEWAAADPHGAHAHGA
jgi:methylmalonyl-CoA/ethylmalonyl-CoA epimerase